MNDSMQSVLMKGTQEGITVYLNDECSFEQLLNELKTKLETSNKEDRTELILHSQYRYFEQNRKSKSMRLLKRIAVIELSNFNLMY